MVRKTFAVYIEDPNSIELVEYDLENKEFPKEPTIISIKGNKKLYDDLLNYGNLLTLDVEKIKGDMKGQIVELPVSYLENLLKLRRGQPICP